MRPACAQPEPATWRWGPGGLFAALLAWILCGWPGPGATSLAPSTAGTTRPACLRGPSPASPEARTATCGWAPSEASTASPASASRKPLPSPTSTPLWHVSPPYSRTATSSGWVSRAAECAPISRGSTPTRTRTVRLAYHRMPHHLQHPGGTDPDTGGTEQTRMDSTPIAGPSIPSGVRIIIALANPLQRT